jgi:hypothetical protein
MLVVYQLSIKGRNRPFFERIGGKCDALVQRMTGLRAHLLNPEHPLLQHSSSDEKTTHKGRCHRSQQAAVADLEALFIANFQCLSGTAHNQVVTRCSFYFDSWGAETRRIGVLLT